MLLGKNTLLACCQSWNSEEETAKTNANGDIARREEFAHVDGIVFGLEGEEGFVVLLDRNYQLMTICTLEGSRLSVLAWEIGAARRDGPSRGKILGRYGRRQVNDRVAQLLHRN